MLAGVTRIIEICFFSQKQSGEADDDNRSDHTLNSSGPQNSTENGSTASRAFRHLPPFVSIYLKVLLYVLLTTTDSAARLVRVRNKHVHANASNW